MKNKLKPINSTKIISTQIRNNSKTEIVLPKKKQIQHYQMTFCQLSKKKCNY